MARLYLLAPRSLVREALGATLARGGHRVVGADGEPDIALAELNSTPVDLLVADVQHGARALQDLLAPAVAAAPGRSAQRCVVLMGTAGATQELRSLPAAPVWAWVQAHDPPERLLRAVGQVLAGERQAAPWEAAPGGGDPLACLDAQQRQVLALSARGQRLPQIAQALGLPAWTVAQCRRDAMRAAGLRDAAALVRFALRHGLIEPGA